MNCKAASKLIMKHMDGVLSDMEAELLMQHIKACRRCEQEYVELDAAMSALEAGGMHEPPQDFGIQVMRRIKEFEASRLEINKPEAEYSRAGILAAGKPGINKPEVSKHGASPLTKALCLFAAAVFMVISFLFSLGREQIDAIGVLLGLFEPFEPVWDITGKLLGIVEIGATVVRSVTESALQAALVLARHYYYVIVMLLSLLFAIQWTLVVFVRSSRGGAKG